MRATKYEPILTETYENLVDFVPTENSIYIYGDGVEARAAHVVSLRSSSPSLTYFRVENESQNGFQIAGREGDYFLRSRTSLASLWEGLKKGTRIYIDMTGLTHPVWAALLRSAVLAELEVLFVYVEPDKYTRSNAPVDGQIYDLSARVNGVSPLAGFAVLSTQTADKYIFVPLLGFEGTRLRFLLEQVQPGSEQIFPVLGSPGFKPWYVFESYLGNRNALSETSAWQSIRSAAGNCPFSCHYVLMDLHQSNPDAILKIALIGTKPHALGAVLFSLVSGCQTELVYDHPMRKHGRTEGTDRLLVYHVSAIVSFEMVKGLERPQGRRIRRSSND